MKIRDPIERKSGMGSWLGRLTLSMTSPPTAIESCGVGTELGGLSRTRDPRTSHSPGLLQVPQVFPGHSLRLVLPCSKFWGLCLLLWADTSLGPISYNFKEAQFPPAAASRPYFLGLRG